MTTSSQPAHASAVSAGLQPAPAGQRPDVGGAATPSTRVLALPAGLALAVAAFALATRQAGLQHTFIGTGLALLVWCAALWYGARRARRSLAVAVVLRRNHWLQACAQGTLIVYWAAHTPLIATLLPFVASQLLFAYAVDSLLSWSRRDRYALGFGPFPVIFSINLFLLFRPEWFYWQFAMIALGFAAKEFIHWRRDGRSAHIFNPSSFPLAVFSLVLLATHSTHLTFGETIANTLFDTPHIHLVIFLVALPAAFLFGIAPVTIAAAVTLYAFGLGYLAVTGTYLFYDAYIPPAVFIGMTLLVTDPSTSPTTRRGRLLFGVLYSLGTAVLFIVLERAGAPTFYDKLLPVPLLNLMVRAIDRVMRAPAAASFEPRSLRRMFANAKPAVANALTASVWVAVFVPMLAVRAVGDTHPGQYFPFWNNACVDGSARACQYVGTMTGVYCQRGSGWACNDLAVLESRTGDEQRAAQEFRRACSLGYTAGCENSNRPIARSTAFASGAPDLRDLPIVLAGTKPPLQERDPAKLYAIACEQRWPGACAAASRGIPDPARRP